MSRSMGKSKTSAETLARQVEDLVKRNNHLRAKVVDTDAKLRRAILLFEDVVYGDAGGAHARAKAALDYLEGASSAAPKVAPASQTLRSAARAVVCRWKQGGNLQSAIGALANALEAKS